MKTWERNVIENRALGQVWPWTRQSTQRSNNLHLVTANELQALRQVLAKGDAPADLEAKLASLAVGNLGHRFIEQNCRTMLGGNFS